MKPKLSLLYLMEVNLGDLAYMYVPIKFEFSVRQADTISHHGIRPGQDFSQEANRENAMFTFKSRTDCSTEESMSCY